MCLSGLLCVCSSDSLLLLQSLINRLWLGMNLEDAIAAPIVFVDSKNNVNFEPGFDKVKYFCFNTRCPLKGQ